MSDARLTTLSPYRSRPPTIRRPRVSSSCERHGLGPKNRVMQLEFQGRLYGDSIVLKRPSVGFETQHPHAEVPAAADASALLALRAGGACAGGVLLKTMANDTVQRL